MITQAAVSGCKALLDRPIMVIKKHELALTIPSLVESFKHQKYKDEKYADIKNVINDCCVNTTELISFSDIIDIFNNSTSALSAFKSFGSEFNAKLNDIKTVDRFTNSLNISSNNTDDLKSYNEELRAYITTQTQLLNTQAESVKTVIDAEIATTTNRGVASFATADFTVASGAVTIKNVNLGTQTTGDYVANIQGTANEVTVSPTSGEGTTVTIGLPDDVTITNNLNVGGNLNVTGTINSVNTTQVNIVDNKINLNTDFTGSPTADAGIRVERGEGTDVEILWNESDDRWTLTNNGTNYHAITRKYSATIGNGSLTQVPVTHNLGARDVTVQVYDSSTFDLPGNLIATSKNSIAFTEIAEDNYLEYRWNLSAELKAGEDYWVVLEITTTPQGGNIVIASQTPYSDKTYENLESESFSFVNVIDTSDMKFTIPARVLLNTDNTSGALTNSGQLVFDIYSDNSDSIGEYQFTISTSIDFADFTEVFTNYSFTAASVGFSFVKDTKYWVISRTTVRPRGGVINLDLNNIIIDPIRHRIENSGTYNIWKDNSRKIWLALYEDFPQVYGIFNRFNSGMSKYLPVANDKRSISSSYIREGYWSFTAEKFAEPSDVYIYPRAVGIEDATPPSNVDFGNPPAYWAYVPYYNDIYISIRLICGGKIKDYTVHLDPTTEPEPILVNSDEQAEAIAYMFVAKTLEELENGYHGAPAGDRLVLRSS